MKIDSIKTWGIDAKRPIIIAGPCSAETEEQVMTTAKELHEYGVQIFRAGIWKPRTRPNTFEGVGFEGLQWLKRVKEEIEKKYDCCYTKKSTLWDIYNTISFREYDKKGNTNVFHVYHKKS